MVLAVGELEASLDAPPPHNQGVWIGIPVSGKYGIIPSQFPIPLD